MENQLDFEKEEKRDKKKNRFFHAVTYLLLSLWGLIVLFPFYWMVLTSLKDYGAYNSERIPEHAI